MTLDTCSRCGKSADGIGAFGAAYRAKELQAGRGDPSHLCGECAGSRDGRRASGCRSWLPVIGAARCTDGRLGEVQDTPVLDSPRARRGMVLKERGR